MNLDIAQAYATIVKQEKQADGTLKVYGKATDDSVDIDQQICDEAWLKKAMPDWFQSGGNVREQHSNIAAGVATDYESKADGHYITALVVDPVSVKKVETGVLKGFSIGIRGPRVIRDTKAAGGRIVDGQIVEVSLVDRPANPNAKLMLAKAASNGSLEMVKQFSMPTPADVAKASVIVNGMTQKSDNPIADIIHDVEQVVETVEETVTDLKDGDISGAIHEGEKAVDEIVADISPVTSDIKDIDEQAVQLINEVKSILPTLTKFDQATFDRAREALSDLIIVEANEMKTGSDERDSIKELLHSIKHLFEWYEGEAEEGEVINPDPALVSDIDADSIFLAAKSTDACECECDKCADSKGCDAKMCKCASTKSADPEDELIEELPDNAGIDEIVLEVLTADDSVVADIVDKAVASARAAVTEEIAVLQSALKAEQEKAIQLQGDLDTANKAAVAGGPKRAAITKSTDSSELLQKAAEYSLKASATADPMLAKGYRELANDLRSKAEKGQTR